MAPYAYLLTGLTLITIESSGLTQADKAWFVALSRTEEIFVGIIAVLIVTPLFGLRRPRLEFERLASSAVEQLKNLANAELQNIREGTSSSSELEQEQTAVLRKLLSLGSLLIAERRESLYFRGNTALLYKIRNSLQSLFQAVVDLGQSPVDCKVLGGRFQAQFEVVQDLFKHSFSGVNRGSMGDPLVLASAFQVLDAKNNGWLRSGDINEIPAYQLAAYLRCWDALRGIQNELLNLYDLENQLRRSTQDTVLQSDPHRDQRKIDRRLVIVGIKGGLVSVVSLFLVVWLHLPGASIIPTAAWTAVLVTSYEIPFGRPGHVRSFQNLLKTASYGLLIVLVALLLTPFMSDYWFMNLILFCILFAYGYFASKTPGMTFWMLGTLLLVSVLVALNAQKAVPFATIMDSYLGVMIGLTIGVTIARVLWPTLPQNELRKAAARFCDAATFVLDEKSEVPMSSINSTLSILPLELARTTAALGVNHLLRQEQAKWNRLVPIVISLSAQLPRLRSIRAKVVDSHELRLYLDSFHQDFRSWMEALGRYFRRPDGKKTLSSVRGLIDRLQQRMEHLKVSALLHPSSNGPLPETLLDVNEYLVAAELLQQCGDIASSLRLVEYGGDYFL